MKEVIADVEVAVDVVDNNKIVTLEDITCDRLPVIGIICMIFYIFFLAYVTSMNNTFKIELFGIGIILPSFFLFSFIYPTFGKRETKVFRISEIERYDALEGGDLYYLYDEDVNKYEICFEFLHLLKEGDVIEALIRKKRILNIGYIVRENIRK